MCLDVEETETILHPAFFVILVPVLGIEQAVDYVFILDASYLAILQPVFGV